MLHLLLLLLQLPSLQLLSSAYTPPDKYFIDCGSKSNTTFTDGRIFVGDLNPPFSLSSRKSNHVRDNNPLSNISSLYHTARIYREPSSYELQVNQNGTHMVRLHFFCFSSPINLSDAVFDVWVDPPSFSVLASGFLLLSNFSCRNSSNLPVIEEFLLTINQGKFRLYFIPSQESSLAFISAIEIFPTPENFIPDSVARLTSAESNGNYSGLLSRVLHTIHRIGVGGPKITPDNDILWRNWVPDDRYLANPDATKNGQFYSDRLDDQSEGFTNHSAPDYVYKTAKDMNISCKQAIVSNIILHFPVVKNAMQHLVRVHFCNLISQVPSLLEFSISINCKFTRRIRVNSMINDLAAPFYFDFVVDSDGFAYVDISIALLPENIADRNAFLNGLEIFEIQKKSGALPIQGEPMKMNQSTSEGSYFGFVMVMGIIALIPDLKRRRAKLATEESNSQDCQAERNKIIAVAWNFDRGLRISFSKIRKGTKNFDSKLLIGEGRFGKVYKGTLQGTTVAVKQCIPRDRQDFMEFETEIMVSSRIRHLHLVPLIGYCDDKSEKILISEYMELGTLRDHLYGFKKMHSTLSWVKRLEICIGVAKGLNYLHTGSAEGIIHRDVTSANILLDRNFVAKISGFGLCKSSLSEPHTSVEGTLGYVDPEYVSHSVCTEKSDVYSFGVVLLEVLCARPPVLDSSQREDTSLVERAMLWQQKGQLEKIIDPVLVDDNNLNSLNVVGEIAVKCLNIRGAQRPTMQEVEWHLIYALKAVRVEPNEGGSTSHSLDIALLIAQPMLSLDNLAKRTANIPVAPSLNLDLLKISLAKLRKATNNFDAKLLVGEGGFGKVYKGTLQGIEVAVKRSRLEDRQSFLQFETEIKVLSKFRHRHLVQLIGYCAEKSEMIMVFEFMEKGVLRDHLYESRNTTGRSLTRSKPSWGRRLEICIGVAKSLHHLHAGSDVRIIHRDINSANILLDKNYVAKVADFGFSRLGLSDSSLNIALSTTLLGTPGYLDPEYFYSSRCTTKSDVYSFGVVLLEVLCARPPIIRSSDREQRNLVEWAMLWHRKGQLKKIIDPILVGEANPESLRVVGEIAQQCLNVSSAERPTMQDVEWHLIYALNLQQHASLLGPYEDNASTHSVNNTLPSDQHMFYEENLAEGTANISISPNLNLDLKISLAETKKATNNFDARLLIGEGGFGKVYRGTLKGISVAVKRSEPGHDQGFMEFQREIMVFSQIQHPHLVSFIGYCDERSEMILIYKFVENGALRDYLYNSKGRTERSSTQFNLSWEKRLEICIGAAKGLHYLHTGLAEGIIHRDVKAANILLDEQFVAKVADFGISKLGPPDPLHYSLVVKGTIGYVDPEVLTFGEFTKKSDVYAFGVVLLEVICARPAIIASSQREEINLAEWGMIWQRKGQLEKIMDPVLVGEINMSSLSVVGETAEKCLKLNSAERPTMHEVELQLKYALELQQSAVQSVSYEDCSTSASMESALPSVRPMLSIPFHVEEHDVFIQVDDDFDSFGGDDASESFFSVNSSPDNLV